MGLYVGLCLKRCHEASHNTTPALSTPASATFLKDVAILIRAAYRGVDLTTTALSFLEIGTAFGGLVNLISKCVASLMA